MEFVIAGLFVAVAALVGATPKLWTMRLAKKAAELEAEIQSECWHIDEPFAGDSQIRTTLHYVSGAGDAMKCRRCGAFLGPETPMHQQRLADLFGKFPQEFLQQFQETQTVVCEKPSSRKR